MTAAGSEVVEGIDPRYECDAPLYVDFEQLNSMEEFNDGADSWFDRQVTEMQLINEEGSTTEDDKSTSKSDEGTATDGKNTGQGHERKRRYKYYARSTTLYQRAKLRSSQPYVPMAEQLLKFYEMPDRYRTKPKDHKPGKASGASAKLTEPKTPILKTMTRSRALCVESAAEKEAQAAKEVKSYQFKAKPFNPDIVTKEGQLGVPMKASRPVTQAVTPRVLTEQTQKHQLNSEEQTMKFQARPLPKSILNKVTGVPEKRLLDCTEPESPAFTLKKRKVEWDRKEAERECSPEPVCVPIPLPPLDKPVFQPELPHKSTAVDPFSFDVRYKGRPSRKEIISDVLKRREETAKVEANFKANPLPSMEAETVVRPGRKIEPLPFNLECDKRGEKKHQEFLERVKEEEKAKTAPVKPAKNVAIYSEPFVPRKADKLLVDIQNFVLNTEHRSQQRAIYDLEKKEREQQKELEMKAKREEEEKEEKIQLKEYRQLRVHKSRPIRRYKQVAVVQADNVTTPITPQLATRERSRLQK